MYNDLPYDLHETWARDGYPAMDSAQEAQEERVHGLLDKAYHVIMHPEQYTEAQACAILDECYWEKNHSDYTWSYDLQERLDLTINLLEAAA